MLYRIPKTNPFSLYAWLSRYALARLQRRTDVDLRSLSDHLRRDLGMIDGHFPTRF